MLQGTCFIVAFSRTDGSDHSIMDLVIVRMGLKEDPDLILMDFEKGGLKK
jgi:hypothetical protein